MIGKVRRRWRLFGVILTVLLIGAWTASASVSWLWPRADDLAQALDRRDDPATTARVPVTVEVAVERPATVTPSSRQTATVRRGSIADVLSLSGRVAGQDEVVTTVASPARVESVAVAPGQLVEEGQLLLKADGEQIVKDLEAARARAEVSAIRLAQAQARQREAERQVENERARRQASIDDAESGVRRAQADYERVRAGAPASERQAAESAVQSARAGLARAEAELERVTRKASEIDMQAADQQVWATRLALQRAEEELERLRRGPDPTELRAAERDVANAEVAVLRVTSDLDRIVRGADPLAVSAARRDVERAELALRAAQAAKSGKDKSERQAREVAIRSAELSLQDARDRLARLNVPPPAGEVEAAQRSLATAREALAAARERRDVVARGPSDLVLAAANQAVESARTAAASAEARYLELEAGPPPDQVRAARHAVESARAALASAASRQVEVNSRPTRGELREAEERLAASQNLLERARAEVQDPATPREAESDPASFDLMVLEKSVQQDRAVVETLERDLAATRLTAPFAGVVAAVHVQPGDPLEPGRPVVTLARPGEPVVRADLSDREVNRLAPGQSATVQIDGQANQQFEATVAAVESATGTVPRLQLRVDWLAAQPVLGANAQLAVTLQRKDGVLLVPLRAVRSLGQRRVVEVVDGASRQNVDVQVGIVQGGDAEIVSGLSEGQLVVVGP